MEIRLPTVIHRFGGHRDGITDCYPTNEERESPL